MEEPDSGLFITSDRFEKEITTLDVYRIFESATRHLNGAAFI